MPLASSSFTVRVSCATPSVKALLKGRTQKLRMADVASAGMVTVWCRVAVPGPPSLRNMAKTLPVRAEEPK